MSIEAAARHARDVLVGASKVLRDYESDEAIKAAIAALDAALAAPAEPVAPRIAHIQWTDGTPLDPKLEAEIRAMIEKAWRNNPQVRAEIDRVAAAPPAVPQTDAKYAARYRWLRDGYNHCDDGLPYAVKHIQNDWGKWVTPVLADEELDAAIDAAMSTEQPK